MPKRESNLPLEDLPTVAGALIDRLRYSIVRQAQMILSGYTVGGPIRDAVAYHLVEALRRAIEDIEFLEHDYKHPRPIVSGERVGNPEVPNTALEGVQCS